MLLPTLGTDQIFKIPHTKEDFKIVHHHPLNIRQISPAHQQDFYRLFLVEKGSGTYTIDFKEYPVKDKMIFFLTPAQTCQWDLSPKTSGYQLLFSAKFLWSGNQHFPYFNTTAIPFLTLTDDQYTDLFTELQKADKELNHTKDPYIEILQNRLQIILLLLKRWYDEQFEEQEFTTDQRIINSFLAILEKHYTRYNEVSFYATQLSVSPNYLNQVCRTKSGNTAGDYIREKILLEAKKMLALTKLDIQEIARTLGFSDGTYFSRFFKKHTTFSPLAFRKMNR